MGSILIYNDSIYVVALLVIITACDRNGLYCSSVSLLNTLDNPTTFCTLTGEVVDCNHVIYHYDHTGALFHYCFMNMMLWWFCNVIVLFHKVMFPFQANRFEKLGRNKFILAAAIVLCKQ